MNYGQLASQVLLQSWGSRKSDVIVAIREREGNTAMSLDITWEQKLSIGQFYGIELKWWPARIAETAMFLVDHQANRELADRVGLAPERLPIRITAHITHANALAVDWRNVLPETTGQTYVFGNPPFIGQYTKTKDQTAKSTHWWPSRTWMTLCVTIFTAASTFALSFGRRARVGSAAVL